MRRSAAARALLASNERQIVDAFRARRAVSIRAAQPLRDLGLNDSQVLRGMVSAAILRSAGPGRYFLDESQWAGRRQLSGRTIYRGALGLAFALAVAAFYFLV